MAAVAIAELRVFNKILRYLLFLSDDFSEQQLQARESFFLFEKSDANAFISFSVIIKLQSYPLLTPILDTC